MRHWVVSPTDFKAQMPEDLLSDEELDADNVCTREMLIPIEQCTYVLM